MADITLVDVPDQLVLGLQKRGRYPEIRAAIRTLFEYGVAHGVEFTGRPIAMMHELGRKAAVRAEQEGNVVIDVACPVAAEIEADGDILCYLLPGGLMARIVHNGPYESCEPAYNALFEWISTNGYMITDPTREVYLNDASMVKSHGLIMEIYAPVERL